MIFILNTRTLFCCPALLERKSKLLVECPQSHSPTLGFVAFQHLELGVVDGDGEDSPESDFGLLRTLSLEICLEPKTMRSNLESHSLL